MPMPAAMPACRTRTMWPSVGHDRRAQRPSAAAAARARAATGGGRRARREARRAPRGRASAVGGRRASHGAVELRDVARGGASRSRCPTRIASGSRMPFQRARSRWSTRCCHAILSERLAGAARRARAARASAELGRAALTGSRDTLRSQRGRRQQPRRRNSAREPNRSGGGGRDAAAPRARLTSRAPCLRRTARS